MIYSIPYDHQFIDRSPHFTTNVFLRLISGTTSMPQLFYYVHYVFNTYLNADKQLGNEDRLIKTGMSGQLVLK